MRGGAAGTDGVDVDLEILPSEAMPINTDDDASLPGPAGVVARGGRGGRGGGAGGGGGRRGGASVGGMGWVEGVMRMVEGAIQMEFVM